MFYEFMIVSIGWLYPSFATYDALHDEDRNGQLGWMKYWIVLGLFTIVHFFTAPLGPWVPFIGFFKFILLCWLLPTFGGGSVLIHDHLIDRLVTRNKIVINQALDNVSVVSSGLLREMIKMVYHLSVDVVEQCWLLTRNEDDNTVTPRLQSAINDVIAELRAARRAAAFMPLIFPSGEAETVDPAAGQMQQQQQQQQQHQLLSRGRPYNMSDDDIALRILWAEALDAERMQRRMQLSNLEYLAPITNTGNAEPTPVLDTTNLPRPVKPKRSKRNASRLEEPELNANQAYCECGGYCDMCALVEMGQ